MNYARYAEDGIRMIFGESIDLAISAQVRRYWSFLKSLQVPGIIDIIPSFSSILIQFDANRTSFDRLITLLREREEEGAGIIMPERTHHRIPVRYGGEYGPDMEFVTSYTGVSEEEIVEIHTSTVYTVFAIGFIPGFPYLGMVDRRLYTPRLESPRLKVPEGSVGLAQLQTGIYPFESPAGWRIIGKTDVQLFDHRREPHSLFKMGDTVRFIPL
jgi:inhibitor of KinA